jgi:hypothetical protein
MFVMFILAEIPLRFQQELVENKLLSVPNLSNLFWKDSYELLSP